MGTVKAIAGLLAIILIVYSGFQIIPPELSNYSFQDDLHNISMMAGANLHQSDQDTLDAVMRKAQEHNITLTPEQVTVQRMNAAGSVAIYVAADYSVPVSLPGYSFTLHFTPNSGNKGF
jgi:hypothetical protein